MWFVFGSEFLEHEVGSGEVTDKVIISEGDMELDEGSVNLIVVFPDVISVRSDRGVGARKGAIEPRFESSLQCQQGKFTAPFHPIGFSAVKNKIRRPISFVESAIYCNPGAAGSDRAKMRVRDHV